MSRRSVDSHRDAFAALLAARRDRSLLVLAAAFFLVWLLFTGPVRWLALAPAWPLVLGSAPNFFAGMTLCFWQAFAVPGPAIYSGALAFAVLAVGEAVQLLLPHHRADGWDVMASALGALLATAVVARTAASKASPAH